MVYSNPILLRTKYIAAYFIFWLSIAVIYFLLLRFGTGVGLSTALGDSLLFSMLLGVFGLSYWYPAKFISFENTTTPKILLNHFASAVISTAVWLLFGYIIANEILRLDDNYSQFFKDSVYWKFLIGMLFYFLFTSAYYIIIYYTTLQERKVKEAELKNLITEAELRNLKFQINPHFIFNTLNSISALTAIDPNKAREMTIKLADFLRYTLSNNEKQKNKFSEELKNIKLYLDIEKVRFGEKIEIRENIDQKSFDILVPNMILQPLVENAIKHGAYDNIGQSFIEIRTLINNNFLSISVENNFESDASHRKGEGVGLANIRNRLKLIYGHENLFELQKGDSSFKATLFIPMNN